MKYEKKILISRYEVDYINRLLRTTNRFGEDDTVTSTVKLDNGIEMDIKLCGADNDYPWTDLFDYCVRPISGK